MSQKKSSFAKNKPETQISKPSLHDVFYRGVFEEKKYSMDIFKLILTPNEFNFFNWRTLKLEANTFINEYLKESRTDLVFSVKPKGSKIETQVVFLMEHKSYTDSKVMEQLLKYQAASYLRTPAPILPIIVYHGKNKDYKGPLGFYGNLEKLHNPSIRRSLSKNVLNFNCRLLNLRRLDSKKIEHLTSAPMLFILGNIWEVDKPVLCKLFSMVKKISHKSDRATLVSQAIEYVRTFKSDITWKILLEVEQEVLGQEESMIKPFQFSIDQAAEKGLKKGLRKGRKEGIEKGIEKGLEKVALNLLKEGMNASQISKVTGMSKDEVKALQIKKAG